jgi:saccharopine dehydrogenase (NAD+, L-lysine forming)
VALSQSAVFGIVGAYGATGRVVVSELLKSTDGELLVGGRDPAKLKLLAAESGSRVSTASLNVLDAPSLDEFCSRCSIIVNCGGPVVLLQDCVAQAALRGHCHYVDPAGMSVVKERMLPHGKEIADLGLSFVVSAGWTPGITELLPIHAYAQAKTQMDSIESVKVYFSDSGEWSANALRDGVSYIRGAGLSRPGYFRKGEWVRAKTLEASGKLDMGDPIGLRRFSLFSMPELNEVGRRLTDCNFLTYSYLSGFRNAGAAILIALLPLSEKSGVKLLRNIFRRNRLPVAGFVVVHVFGRSEGRSAVLRSRIVFDAGRDYWMNGVVLATVARMMSSGKGVRAGIHFLSEAVDPIAFMGELRKAGVQQTEVSGSHE